MRCGRSYPNQPSHMTASQPCVGGGPFALVATLQHHSHVWVGALCSGSHITASAMCGWGILCSGSHITASQSCVGRGPFALVATLQHHSHVWMGGHLLWQPHYSITAICGWGPFALVATLQHHSHMWVGGGPFALAAVFALIFGQLHCQFYCHKHLVFFSLSTTQSPLTW